MIVFTTGIEPYRLYMAYNNHIVRFKSDTANATPLYCDITAGIALSVRLYPDPQGDFFFNFKPYVSALINKRNFNDTTSVEINSNDPAAFIYSFSHGTFLQLMVNFRITLQVDETTQTTEITGHALSWLAGVEQINDYNNFSSNGLYVLSPFRKLSADDYYLKYWQGYPFDMPVYTSGTGITLHNDTNLLSATFSVLGYGSRLFFSDGRTDESLEDLLPLIEGYNKLRLTVHGSTASDKYILLEKMGYKSGIYLKWLNKYGGYSYWLFEDTYSIDRSTKHMGEIDRDNANLDEASTRTWQMGKESQDTIKVIAELLTEDERRIVEGILDSPKIYLFTGQPYSRSSLKDWTEVSLKTTSARLKNAKQPLTNFTFDIELPSRYTQTL
jgi:hypothetical protein